MMKAIIDIVVGAEIRQLSEDLYRCKYCVLKLEKSAISITETKILDGNITAIVNGLPKSVPLALTLTGKGILCKSTSADAIGNDILKKAFPAIDAADFYSQVYTEHGCALVAITRKAHVDELLTTLKTAGINVLQVSISGIPAVRVLAHLEAGIRPAFDGHTFQMRGEIAEAYHFQDGVPDGRVLKLGSEPVSAELILAYASGFQLLLADKLTVIRINAGHVGDAFISYAATQKFKQQAQTVLIACFVLLMISYGTFSWYNSDNNRLQALNGAKLRQQQDEDQLLKNIGSAARQLHELGWNNGYNPALLVDQLGSSLPRQLRLTELQLEPVQTNGNVEDFTGRISVTGDTKDLMALNNWTYVLRELQWVKAVKLVKYIPGKDDGQYTFKLNLQY